MTPLEQFYTDDPRWYEKIGDIHALLERVKSSEEQSGDVLHLRKLSRILSIHASTAIEGNRLTPAPGHRCDQRQTGLGAAQGHQRGTERSAIRCTDTSISRPKQ
jgi:hypothetical protein